MEFMDGTWFFVTIVFTICHHVFVVSVVVFVVVVVVVIVVFLLFAINRRC